MELVQITLMAEKQKWLNYFRQHNRGGVKKRVSPRIYSDAVCRFFVARHHNTELGRRLPCQGYKLKVEISG